MIPNDVSRCNNKNCVLKDGCKRFTEKGGERTPYNHFVPVVNKIDKFNCNYKR